MQFALQLFLLSPRRSHSLTCFAGWLTCHQYHIALLFFFYTHTRTCTYTLTHTHTYINAHYSCTLFWPLIFCCSEQWAAPVACFPGQASLQLSCRARWLPVPGGSGQCPLLSGDRHWRPGQSSFSKSLFAKWTDETFLHGEGNGQAICICWSIISRAHGKFLLVIAVFLPLHWS